MHYVESMQSVTELKNTDWHNKENGETSTYLLHHTVRYMVTDILEEPTASVNIFNQQKHNAQTWILIKRNKSKIQPRDTIFLKSTGGEGGRSRRNVILREQFAIQNLLIQSEENLFQCFENVKNNGQSKDTEKGATELKFKGNRGTGCLRTMVQPDAGKQLLQRRDRTGKKSTVEYHGKIKEVGDSNH